MWRGGGRLVYLVLLVAAQVDGDSDWDTDDIAVSDTTGASYPLNVRCCEHMLADAEGLLQCLQRSSGVTLQPNGTLRWDRGEPPPASATPRIAILTQVTDAIESYARYTVMVNLAYAATFGHTLIVAGALHGSHPAPPPMDPRFGKVQLLHRVLSSGHFDVVMWLDADAALVEFARDVVGELAAAHLVGPGENNKELLVCREPVDVSEPSVVNSGSLMLRHSPWALRFLRQWWEHPDAQRGAADQRVFDRLWAADGEGLRGRTALLPTTALNSEALFFEGLAGHAWQAIPPVLHLMGSPNEARRSLLQALAQRLCDCSGDPQTVLTWEEHRGGGGGGGVAKTAASSPLPADGGGSGGQLHERQGWGGERDLPPAPPTTRASVDWMVGEYSKGLQWYLDANARNPEAVTAMRLLARAKIHASSQDHAVTLAALALLREAMDHGTRLLGPSHPILVQVMTDTAILLADMGHFKEALQLHQQCLAIKQAVLPSDHALISKSYNNIGALLGQLGQYPEAARYQQLSLNMISSIMGEGAGGAEGGRQTVSGDHATDAVAQPVDADRMERRAGGVEGAAEGPACSADEDAAARLRRDSPDVILLGRSLNNMGNLKAKMGLYSEARAYHERSISIIEASMGMQHALLAKPLSSLATLLHVMGNETATAWALAQRAYRIRLRAFGDAHSEVADSASTLGVLHLAAGNVERALEWHRQAHSIWSAVYGPNHPQVAMALSNIAAVYAAQAQFAQALQARQQCLLIERRSLGESHPQVASSLNNLGVVLEAMGRYDEALDALNQCHTLQLQLLSADHPDLAATLNNLGKVLHRTAKHDEALVMLREALRLRERSFGLIHPKVAETLNILAVVLDDVGQYEEAEVLCRRALAIRTAVVDAAAAQGPEHQTAIQLELASSLGNLAALLQRKRQPLAALHHAKRALSIKELFLGPNHPDVATAANNVGELLKLSGSPVEATQHYQHALRVWRTHLGSSHPHVAVALLNLGQLTETLGKVDHAESYMLQGLAVFSDRLREPHALRCDTEAEQMDGQRLPDCHPVLGALFNNLSLLYHHMGRLQPAVFCMQRAVHVRTRLLGEQHPDTLNSYRRLASLRERLAAAEDAGAVSAARWADGDDGGAAALRAGEERHEQADAAVDEEEDGEEDADQMLGYEQ